MHGYFPLRLWPCHGTLLYYEHCLFLFIRIYQEEDQSATGSGVGRFKGLDSLLSCLCKYSKICAMFPYVQRTQLDFGGAWGVRRVDFEAFYNG